MKEEYDFKLAVEKSLIRRAKAARQHLQDRVGDITQYLDQIENSTDETEKAKWLQLLTGEIEEVEDAFPND